MRRSAIIFALLAVVGIAWSMVWHVIAQRTERVIDTWVAEERMRDRNWTCASRRTAGFPFALKIECAAPVFTSQAGPLRSAEASRVMATAGILSPSEIAFSVHGPLKVVSMNGSATLYWDVLDGAVYAAGGSPDVSVHARDLRIGEASGEAAEWLGSFVQEVRARVRRTPDRAPRADAQTISFTLTGARLPPVDSFFGNKEALSGSLSATILNAGVATTGAFAQRLERWSAADGRLQVNSLVAEKGDSRIEASGDLTVDDRRRPAGQLSLRMNGLQPILARFKLPAAPLAIEGLLRGSGNRPGGASLLENRTIPVELRGGRVYIGPIRTPISIPPLI